MINENVEVEMATAEANAKVIADGGKAQADFMEWKQEQSRVKLQRWLTNSN